MLFIHKNIIKNNIFIITKKFNKIPAFVLKSDAYGLGIKNILPILLETYSELSNNYDNLLSIFVRDVEEGQLVRKIYNKSKFSVKIKDINIIILNSIEKKNIKSYEKYNLIPIINHKDEVDEFKDIFIKLPTIINIDTGMNRTGIKYENMENFLIDQIKKFYIIGLMSHLHITNKKDFIHEINYIEKDKFINIIKQFPYIKNITLASSNVMDFGEDFIFSQPRIGKAIYGLSHKDYGLKEAITFKLKISQVNYIKGGEIVGYNGYKIYKDSYLGVVNFGYNHGFSLQWTDNMYITYCHKNYKIISISMEYIIINFENTFIKKNTFVNLFTEGFVKEFINKNEYYLEQLLRFSKMPKKIVN
jgi:alanine racemase